MIKRIFIFSDFLFCIQLLTMDPLDIDSDLGAVIIQSVKSKVINNKRFMSNELICRQNYKIQEDFSKLVIVLENVRKSSDAATREIYRLQQSQNYNKQEIKKIKRKQNKFCCFDGDDE